ncbi:MAG: ribonuclease H-like domain-containing protein [Eubacteriales bacterium]|nr:ribonuclease H-like domain-containing protein [Eubacteriales bacterium]
MDIRTSTHKWQPYRSRTYDKYFGELNVAFLDIETTGLYPRSSKIILGGVLTHRKNHLEMIQYFAENKDEEKSLLSAYCDRLTDSDVLISYNGKNFDLPFLEHRVKYYNLFMDLNRIQCFDLYRALHLYSSFREFLPNLKQKTIENFLGIGEERTDKITGRESVNLYEEYIRTRSDSIKDQILGHNHDDLLQLASILPVLDKLDLHKILFYEGFTVSQGNKRAYIQSISIGKHSLKVTAITKYISGDYYSFETGYQVIHLADSRALTLEIPIESLGEALFLDLETLVTDFSSLEKYPYFHSGYLIICEKGRIHYREINFMVKIFLKQILELI